MKTCNKCFIDKDLSEFYKHKKVCKPCYNQISKKWRMENKDKVKETSHKIYLKHKENRRYPRRKYIENKRKNDNKFKLRESISRLIRESIKNKGFFKKEYTSEILGCSFEEFKLYIESRFEPWMNWENKGKYNGEFNYGWDIDHIIPISSAKTESEMLKLNHYTNLQPLCSKFNRDIKRDKM